MFGFHNVRTLCLAGVAGVTLSLLPLWAMADSIDRVEVLGQAVRTDVTRTCPAIGEQLSERLAPSIGRELQEGQYLVEFSLQGDKLSAVKTAGGAWDARRAVRHAVRGLNCNDAAAAVPQRFAFQLIVRMEDEGGTPVARFDLKPATLLAQAR